MTVGANLRVAIANPKDAVPGSFYFYNLNLDNLTDNPNDMTGRSQAEIVDFEGKHEIYRWGDDRYPGHCLRFSPDKPGDFITFRIHVKQSHPDFKYKVQTISANFDNEGIYQFEVNGNVVGEKHDGYERAPWTHGAWPVKTNEYQITYRYVGKNEKSQGNVLNLMRLEFIIDTAN